MTEAEELRAIEEIKQLKARSFRTLDRKNRDGFGQAFARDAVLEVPEIERVGLQGYGHYLEEYVRENGRWRIARSRLERLRVDPSGAGLPDTSV